MNGAADTSRGLAEVSRRCWHIVVFAVLVPALLSCTTENPNIRVKRLPNDRLQVAGPLMGPYSSLEELAENACKLVIQQPGAAHGRYGFEYCGLYYRAEGAYFHSYLSDIGDGWGNMKYCEVPQELDDPSHPDAIILGPSHNHPHNPEFSPEDMSARNAWQPTRLVDTETRKVVDRHLLLFYHGNQGECWAFRYNYATRVISALRNRQWVSIGKVVDDAGNFRLFEGEAWIRNP